MQEIEIAPTSPLAGMSLAEARLRERAGVLVLAVREPQGSFNTNPDPATVLAPEHVIIAVGTDDAISKMTDLFT